MDLEEFLTEWHNDSPYVCVQTSGSTGTPKPMLVEKRRMEASARITCQFLGLKAGDTALLCLPLDYIAGKMMVVRALTCGLQLVSIPPAGTPQWEGTIDFAAMVPMQVWNMLQKAESRKQLMAIRHLIIGGGAIDDSLAAALVEFPNQVWSTYGMTETLSHIALRRLSGSDATEWYTPLPGVSLSQDEEGCLVIDAPAVHDGPLHTNDIATFNVQRSTFNVQRSMFNVQRSMFNVQRSTFRILGRRDNVICSGGIKIQTEEAERLLRPHLQAPFCITKRKDERLGEAVVLLTEDCDMAAVISICKQELPRFWQPRHYICVAHIPLTETGKTARKEAERIAFTH